MRFLPSFVPLLFLVYSVRCDELENYSTAYSEGTMINFAHDLHCELPTNTLWCYQVSYLQFILEPTVRTVLSTLYPKTLPYICTRMPHPKINSHVHYTVYLGADLKGNHSVGVEVTHNCTTDKWYTSKWLTAKYSTRLPEAERFIRHPVDFKLLDNGSIKFLAKLFGTEGTTAEGRLFDDKQVTPLLENHLPLSDELQD